ncbi:MAG: hypothetical protein ACI8TQ_002108 [Planctomycetota bacterium]|jgi:hypothetical protein
MSNPPPRFRRLFSCLGCLVAGPLGCLSFLGGGVVMALVFLPEVAEQWVLKRMPEFARDQFMGELSVESIDLAWTSAQTIDGILLLDDQGRKVLEGSIVIPPLLALFSPEDGLGLSSLKASLDVVIDETGVSNFERALTLKKNIDDLSYTQTRWTTDLLDVVNFCFKSEGKLEVEIEELVWSIEGEQGFSGIRANDVTVKIELDTAAPLAIVANGLVSDLSSNAQAGSLFLRAHVERNAFFGSETQTRPGVWGGLIAKAVPTTLLDLLPISVEANRDMLGEQANCVVSIEPSTISTAPFNVSFDSGSLSGKASGQLTSSGLLAIYPKAEVAERLSFSGQVRGLTHANVADWLVVTPLAGADLRWDWQADQALAFSVDDLAWVRRGSQPMDGRFEIELPNSSIHFAGARSIELFSTGLQFSRDEDSVWNAEVNGYLGAVDRGRFALEVAVQEPAGGDGIYMLRRIDAQCSQIPIEELDLSLGMGGQLLEVFGSTATFHTGFNAVDDNSGPFDFILQSERTGAEFNGTVFGQPRTMDEWIGALDFNGELGAAGSEWLAPLAFGASLNWSKGVEIEYEGWRPRTLIVGDDIVSKPVVTGPDGSIRSEDVSGGSLTVSVPTLSYRTLLSNGEELELALGEVSLSARGDSDVLRVDLFADVDSGGSLEKHWVFYGLSGPFGIRGNEDLHLRAEAHEFSTAVLDQRFGTDGLIESVFGPVAEFSLTGEGLSVNGGRLTCDIKSDLAELNLTGFRMTSNLMTDAEVTFECLATESALDRIVTPLLPFIESLTFSETGQARLHLVLNEATFSLAGDLGQLAGQVRLDLGALGVKYTEQFNSFLVEPNSAKPPLLQLLKPIKLALGEGRVTCEDVDLPVRDHITRFEGSYGFGGTELDLQIELPLETVGGEANLVLDGMRDNFQPEFPVPLVITGAVIDELDMSVRPQWFRTVSDIMNQFIPDSLQDTMRGLLSEDDGEGDEE